MRSKRLEASSRHAHTETSTPPPTLPRGFFGFKTGREGRKGWGWARDSDCPRPFLPRISRPNKTSPDREEKTERARKKEREEKKSLSFFPFPKQKKPGQERRRRD
ncbi:hypothetical protein ACLOJK_023410 [Asimina triloba]